MRIDIHRFASQDGTDTPTWTPVDSAFASDAKKAAHWIQDDRNIPTAAVYELSGRQYRLTMWTDGDPVDGTLRIAVYNCTHTQAHAILSRMGDPTPKRDHDRERNRLEFQAQIRREVAAELLGLMDGTGRANHAGLYLAATHLDPAIGQ